MYVRGKCEPRVKNGGGVDVNYCTGKGDHGAVVWIVKLKEGVGDRICEPTTLSG